MSVLGRLLIASAERVDLPDLLSIDSFVAGDFKYLLKGLVGDGKPLVLKGFDVINPGDAIGSQSVSIRVAEAVVLYPGSSAGPFFHGLQEGHIQAQPIVPELRKNATNFVYLTFSTFETSRDTRAFWDPDLDGGTGGEFTQDINTESVLKVEVNVSTASFPENTIPVCKVVVGPAVIESIEDARDLMFRLGAGGITPDPFSRYSFRSEPNPSYKRAEPPTKMSTALDPNPFQGGDKNFRNLKEWMDVVMTKLAELGGTTFWYEDASSYSLVNLFLDGLGTSYKSKGKWEHSSATPGQITWTEDILVKSIPDLRDVIIRSGSKTLNNEEVMYIPIVRDAAFNTGNVAVDWFNGLNIVNGVVGAFQNLVKGDWVKKKGDPNHNHLRVEEFYANTNLTGGVTTPALARSIKLSGTYLGLTQTERGARTKGVYTSAEVLTSVRGNGTLEALGGNLHWLAVRTDTIMNVSNITSTTVSGDISDGDGVTAKFTATAPHGLIDGDRFTIAGSTNYDGTYQVEVESSTVFYINTAVTIDEANVDGFYAIVTTTTRSTADGLQLESANHNFKDDETIIVAGTSSSFDASYLIKVRSATTFSIPVPSAIPMVSTGTATLARVNVRDAFSVNELVQGQSIDIGSPDTANILSYIGMGSLAETHPTYNIPPSYNTLDGMANYNSTIDENLTFRVSKLTAMMADKAQDKTIKLLPSGYQSVTNTTNGANQDVVFNPSATPPPKLDIAMPGSDFPNGSVGLTGTLSLPMNSAAYIVIDRNTVFTIANLSGVTVAPIVDVPIDENVLVLAIRLGTGEVWLWDGFYVSSGGPVPVPGYLEQIVRQNNTSKLIGGGTWSWDEGNEELTWDASAFIQVPGLDDADNEIVADTLLIGSNQVAYVEINRASPGGTLTVTVDDVDNVLLTSDTFVIARRDGNDIIVGNHSMRLIDGESKKLYAGVSDQVLEYIGAPDQADATPDYTNATGSPVTNKHLIDGESLTRGVKRLDIALDSSEGRNNQDRTLKLIEGGTWNLVDNAGTYELNLSADAYIEVGGLTKVRNTILAQQIDFPNADSVAYVTVNRDAGIAANLTVTVDDVDNIVLTDDMVIIARRVSDGVLIGAHSFLLKPGEYLELDGALAEINRLLGQLRIKPHETAANKARISTADILLLDSNTLSQIIGDFLLKFDGAVINFTTGVILESDDLTPLGINFTPFSVPVGEYFWYGISLIPGDVTLDNVQEAQVQVDLSASSNASASLAVKPVISGDIKLGAVQVFNNGGTIEVFDIRRLGVGSGSGSGTGDSSAVETALRDRFGLNNFQYLTPNVFRIDKDTKVDLSSTGEYSPAKRAFGFNAPAQTLVSTQNLDADFLASGVEVTEVEWYLFWLKDFIDTAAVYEISRDGGTNWQTADMERIGDTDAYRVYHRFTDEVTQQDLQGYSVANADTNLVLQGGVGVLGRAQPFTVTANEAIRQVEVYLNKLGTPVGNFKVQIVRDDTGLPSTNPGDIIAESDYYSIADLSAGNNTVLVDLASAAYIPGDYWLTFLTDAAYKASYVASTHELAVRADSSAPTAPDSATYNGTTWATLAGNALTYQLKGHVQDLRIRVTSSAGDVFLAGYGVYYSNLGGLQPLSYRQIKKVTFSGDENRTEFPVDWELDPEVVVVYDPFRGQSYVCEPDVLRADGNTLIFEPGTFDFPGETITLIIRQIEGNGIDLSSSNASAITEIQQNLVDIGDELASISDSMVVPLINVPHTTVQNRAQIMDLTQDLMPRLGVQRMVAHHVFPISNEYGPNGEVVSGVANDKLGQIRFIGNWISEHAADGPYVLGNRPGDTFEITFYGTGLNLLAYAAGSARDVRVTIDGGAESANLLPATNASLLSGGFYAINSVLVAARNLTLGIHTARFRYVSGPNFLVYGFDIVNENTSLLVQLPPGSQLYKGKRLTHSILETSAYNSGFETGVLGTKGGRVLYYQKSDGTVAKAVTPVSATQLNLSSANHADEEVARVVNYREMGDSRAGDFATLTPTAADKSFTLDDNTTTLVGEDVACNFPSVPGRDGMGPSTAADFMHFVFTGCGLDCTITGADGLAYTATYQIHVNGIEITSGATAGSVLFGRPNRDGTKVLKIVSGLPYGTHTVKITLVGAGVGEYFTDFRIYQPKTPSMPAGAVAIGAYNIMANYSGTTITGTTVADNMQMPVGALYKAPFREHVYVGANQQFFPFDSGSLPGLTTTTLTNNGQPTSLTFCGTGFVLHMGASVAGTYDFTVSIDGALNATGVARSNASNLGGGSYRCTASASAYQPCRIEFTGLPYGTHTLTFTRTAGTGNITFQGVHVITPIHSHERNGPVIVGNSMSVGSQGVQDLRKFSKKHIVALKSFSRGQGIVSGSTTTSTTYIPAANMHLPIYLAKPARVYISSAISNSNSSGTATANDFTLLVDGEELGNGALPWRSFSGTGGVRPTHVMNDSIVLGAGFHLIQVFWRVSSATGTLDSRERVINIDAQEID